VFSDGIRSYVDFGEKWLELSGLPYQINTALLGFIVGFGTVRILLLMRLQVFKMLLNYHGWMHNPKSTTTKVNRIADKKPTADASLYFLYSIILPVAPRNGAFAGLGIFRTFISAFTIDALARESRIIIKKRK
jgi:hypothetical protein